MVILISDKIVSKFKKYPKRKRRTLYNNKRINFPIYMCNSYKYICTYLYQFVLTFVPIPEHPNI